MPADVILICARVTAEDIEHGAGVLECLPAVVSLDHTYHLRRELVRVLHAADLQGRVEAKRGLGVSVDELLLHELKGRKGTLELLPLERVVASPGY
jgi:hypothetical protein